MTQNIQDVLGRGEMIDCEPFTSIVYLTPPGTFVIAAPRCSHEVSNCKRHAPSIAHTEQPLAERIKQRPPACTSQSARAPHGHTQNGITPAYRNKLQWRALYSLGGTNGCPLMPGPMLSRARPSLPSVTRPGCPAPAQPWPKSRALCGKPRQSIPRTQSTSTRRRCSASTLPWRW